MKRVLIIGAGASGLPAIKSCLDEGLDPYCVERTGDIGGLWNYHETVTENQSCVMHSTIINTSKEMMSYSDFPIPKEYPNFMHNTKVLQYFRLYADTFNLLKYVNFDTEVVTLKQSEDFATTGRWDAQLRDGKSGDVRSESFDAVLVCTGHHACKSMAHFDGEEEFVGQRVHTHDYRDYKGYENKRVVIIGIGNSGGDVAVELSKFCSQVFLSTKRGSWVTNRIGDNGIPVDYALIRRFIFDARKRIPRNLTNWIVEHKLNQRFDHVLYGLKPKHRFDAQHVMVNDDLPNRIASGSVAIKPNIRRITKTGVEFVDGTFEDNIDVIIYATGFVFGFPFIEHKAFEVKKNQIELYKYMFAPDIRPATIAVIGCFQPLGAIMPISEMQCRLACRVFKGDIPLASPDEMWRDVELKRSEMADRYVASQRHTIQVDYATFIDELAELVGCKPDMGHLLKTDPWLALNVYFGPQTPYQYRLTGHGKSLQSRDTILQTWDRVTFPFQTRKEALNEADGHSIIVIIIAIVVLVIIARWLLSSLF